MVIFVMTDYTGGGSRNSEVDSGLDGWWVFRKSWICWLLWGIH
jgi:hypothetical protein